jgi:hypothetical protein
MRNIKFLLCFGACATAERDKRIRPPGLLPPILSVVIR